MCDSHWSFPIILYLAQSSRFLSRPSPKLSLVHCTCDSTLSVLQRSTTVWPCTAVLSLGHTLYLGWSDGLGHTPGGTSDADKVSKLSDINPRSHIFVKQRSSTLSRIFQDLVIGACLGYETSTLQCLGSLKCQISRLCSHWRITYCKRILFRTCKQRSLFKVLSDCNVCVKKSVRLL